MAGRGFGGRRDRERREREERERREREAREKAEREAREKAEREARERVEREQREREERERKEREEREAREREEQERARLKAQAASEAERKKAGRKWFERHVSRLGAVEREQFRLHLWERRSSYATEDEFGAALDGGYYEIAERYGEMRESDAAFDAYWENIKNLSDAELKAQDDKAWDAHDARISAIQAEIERVKAAWEAQAQNPPVQPPAQPPQVPAQPPQPPAQPPQVPDTAPTHGIMCFDADGNVTDINLDSALVVQGTLILGNAAQGQIDIDALFPLRGNFRGIFVMPVYHSLSLIPTTEHAVKLFWSEGRLNWRLPNHAGDLWAGLPWAMGAFAGRQFLYGYFN